ncbi:MAG: MBL fold metallo-hydrolase [Anaerovoracaceae bacterium]|nr:MBL fold metallo-hydrolase [Bacillota bacterium]MEE0517356.1 MBL fold metallo-hydrolase [Anaerovoracaceae bacterium]
MKITFLSDNKTENSLCMAEWGLSVLIESNGQKILFDVGASPLFVQNAQNLGIALSDVDAVVISHGHYDHTEGMEAFCKINKTAPVYIHKDAISEAYGTDRNGRIEEKNCGMRWSGDFLNDIKERLVFTQYTVPIKDNIVISGNIESKGTMTETFYRPSQDGQMKEDDMEHEQILVVKEKEGIHIFSGCSHTGILTDIERAKEIFPGEKIISLTAGMHLYPLSDEEKKKTVESIYDMGVRYLFPVHCTGIKAIMMFKEKFASNCKVAYAGASYEF